MALTSAQLAAVKADILATPSLSANSNDNVGNSVIASFYNSMPQADWMVWQTAVSVQVVYDNVVWANYTPQDTPDGTAIWTNRALACQCKQINLQTLLQGRDTINAAKTAIRTGLQDATTALPSGASGATRSGGWVNIQTAIQRKASNIEKLLSGGGAGTAANPSTLGFEGRITADDIEQARVS